MKWPVYLGVLVVLTLVTLVATAPLSFVMERAGQSVPALRYLGTSGTIWQGRVDDLEYGIQPVGDLALETHPFALLMGRWSADVQLTDAEIVAAGSVSASLGGDVSLKDLRMSGRTRDLMSIRQEVRELDGRFTLDLDELKLRNETCVSAEGDVWTDILTRLETQYDWKGPELSGPVSCEDGRIALRMDGVGEAGEIVSIELLMGLNATGSFVARIESPTEDIAQAATLLGFVTQGNTLEYVHRISR